MSSFMPTLALCDLANRRWGHAEFFAKPALSPTRAIGYTLANVANLFPGEFRRNAFLAVLHRAVSAHVHLVLAMGRPAKIFQAVIGRVSIVVSYVRLAGCGRGQIGKPHQPMASHALELPAVGLQNVYDVSQRRYSPAEALWFTDRSAVAAGPDQAVNGAICAGAVLAESRDRAHIGEAHG